MPSRWKHTTRRAAFVATLNMQIFPAVLVLRAGCEPKSDSRPNGNTGHVAALSEHISADVMRNWGGGLIEMDNWKSFANTECVIYVGRSKSVAELYVFRWMWMRWGIEMNDGKSNNAKSSKTPRVMYVGRSKSLTESYVFRRMWMRN